MVLFDDPLFSIYFGNATDAMHPTAYLTWHDMSLLLEKPQIKPIVQKLQLQQLFFLHQVHGINGYAITPESSLRPFAYDGDYLITNQTAVGLGIVAADCLPVICVDRATRSIGIAHAGWRGALAGVVTQMLTMMQKTWQTQFSNCQMFLGPSAHQCCYRVGEEFDEYLAPYPWRHEVLQKKSNGSFFNLPLFMQYQLRSLGVDTICNTYALCTICNHQFYSSRRSQQGRQMSVVALKG